MIKQDKLLTRLNELNELVSEQDKVISDLLDTLQIYRNNHRKLYSLQQELRSLLTDIDTAININRLYNLHKLEDRIEWLDDLTDDSFNNPEKAVLKFGDLYNDLIGSQKLYNFKNIIIQCNNCISYIDISDSDIPFLNYDYERDIHETRVINNLSFISFVMPGTSEIIPLRFELVGEINNQLRTVSYYIGSSIFNIEFLGFTLIESKVGANA